MIDWKKPTTVAVLLFVIGFMLLQGCETKADTIFEAIPITFIAGQPYKGVGLMMTERFSDRYDLSVMLTTQQTCDCKRGDSPGNLGVTAQRIVQWKRLEMGLGAAYFHNKTPAWNSNTTFALSWGLHFASWSVRHRHYSTGGSSTTNGGWDLLTIGYAFD